MIPVDMTILNHNPDAGIFGDCFRCCIASLLELPPVSVPHFCGYKYEKDEPDCARWFSNLNAWLQPRGLSYVDLQVPKDSKPSEWFEGIAAGGFNVYHVLSGKSPRGFSHSVVARNGVMVFDPHPSRDGLSGPEDEGVYSLGMLIARNGA